MMRNIIQFKKIRLALSALVFFAALLCSCSRHSDMLAGYVDGRFVYVSSEASGDLKKLAVQKGDIVKPGQLLFALDEEPEASYLDRELANLENLKIKRSFAEQNLTFSKQQLGRRQELAKLKDIDPESLDAATLKYKEMSQHLSALDAEIAATAANIKRLRWAKEQKVVYSEVNGVVFDTFFLPSEYVPVAKPVLSIITDDEKFVVFFVPEIRLNQLAVGQQVYVTCDGFQGSVPVKINFIASSPEFTPPMLYGLTQRQNLNYRVEAKSTTVDGIRNCFHVGQPVTVLLKKSNTF
jgi:HlyD family secretion protein